MVEADEAGLVAKMEMLLVQVETTKKAVATKSQEIEQLKKELEGLKMKNKELQTRNETLETNVKFQNLELDLATKKGHILGDGSTEYKEWFAYIEDEALLNEYKAWLGYDSDEEEEDK